MREAQVRFVTKTRKLTKLPTLHELKDRHAGMKCRKITFPYPSYSSSRERSLRTVFDDGQPFPFLHFQLWFLGGLSVYHELMIITVLAAKTDLLRFEVVDGIRAVFKWLFENLSDTCHFFQLPFALIPVLQFTGDASIMGSFKNGK